MPEPSRELVEAARILIKARRAHASAERTLLAAEANVAQAQLDDGGSFSNWTHAYSIAGEELDAELAAEAGKGD